MRYAVTVLLELALIAVGVTGIDLALVGMAKAGAMEVVELYPDTYKDVLQAYDGLSAEQEQNLHNCGGDSECRFNVLIAYNQREL